MKTLELNYELPVLPDPKCIRKERLGQKGKKIPFTLEEVLRELKKKEAEKPLYLTRYE